MHEREFKLLARGVDHLLVNEFLQQNIVDKVRVLDRNSDETRVRSGLANLVFDCA